MFTIRRLGILFLFLIVLFAVWIWWNRPRKVDMATYIPADSVAYFEANDLPALLKGMSETNAWQMLYSPAGIRGDLGRVGWLSKISAWTGIGTAESVVFSRAQIAVAVIGISGSENSEAVQIKPRYAVVIESHSSESRISSVIENRIGSFAQRAYGNPKVERKEMNGAKWTIWNAPSGDRKIIAAVIGSVAIIGNDDEAVLKCLAVRRSEAPNIENNAELQAIRLRLSDNNTAAFGFITAKGAAKLLQTFGIIYAAQSTNDPRALSIAASMLPQLSAKLAGTIGWSAKFSNGGVEDTYFISTWNEVSSKLITSLQTSPNVTLKAAELLPANTYSLTRYNLNNPPEAWHGFGNALALPLDVVSANAVPLVLNAALRSYGIEDAEKFFQSVGNDLYTVRVDESGNSTVVIVQVKDGNALKSIVYQKLGTQTPKTEKINEATILISPDPRRGAAAFVNGYLLLGETENVRRCVQAYAKQESFDKSVKFQKSNPLIVNSNSATVTTLWDDSSYTRTLMTLFSSFKFAREKNPNTAELETAIKQLPYSVTETRIVEGGIERKTNSSFGMFGNLAVQYGSR